MTTFNKLAPAQVERLYYLSEELTKSIQVIQKVLRHGYESSDPALENGSSNRSHLEEELGQVALGIGLLVESGDLSTNRMTKAAKEKSEKLHLWMHHQPPDLLDKLKKEF